MEGGPIARQEQLAIGTAWTTLKQIERTAPFVTESSFPIGRNNSGYGQS